MKKTNCPQHTKDSWKYEDRCFDCVFADGYNKALDDLAKIETWRCTDMGANNDNYVVVRKSDIKLTP